MNVAEWVWTVFRMGLGIALIIVPVRIDLIGHSRFVGSLSILAGLAMIVTSLVIIMGRSVQGVAAQWLPRFAMTVVCAALLKTIWLLRGSSQLAGPMGPAGPVGPTGRQGDKGEKGDPSAKMVAVLLGVAAVVMLL
jgi:hypothetical protein